MSELIEALRKSFITCNSSPKGDYNVQINTGTLKEAHKLHRLILELTRLNQGDSK